MGNILPRGFSFTKKLMAKPCKYDGCNLPRFSGGYCKRHLYMVEKYKKMADKQYFRSSTPLSPRKGYKIPKVSKKRSKELKSYSQIDMFREIWNEMPKPRVCPVSGMMLDHYEGKDNFHWLFAHVLPKGKYPKAKLDKENIVVVHPKVHTLFDQGAEEQRAKFDWNWDYLYKKREELKKKYQ